MTKAEMKSVTSRLQALLRLASVQPLLPAQASTLFITPMFIATSYPDFQNVFFTLCAVAALPGIIGLAVSRCGKRVSGAALGLGLLSILLGGLLFLCILNAGGGLPRFYVASLGAVLAGLAACVLSRCGA